MLLSILLFFSISLVALFIATYTDLRERIVSDRLIAAIIFLGLVVHGYSALTTWSYENFLLSVSVAIATFIGAYAFWKLGVWAGGDVKLFTAIAFLNPVNYGFLRDIMGIKDGIFASSALPIFPLTLFVYSVFAMLPYGAALSFGKVLKDRGLKKKISERLWKGCLDVVVFAGLIAAFSVFLKSLGAPVFIAALFVFALSFFRKFLYGIIGVIFVVLALAIDFTPTVQQFGIALLSLLPLYIILQLYLMSREDVLVMRKKITGLSEGEIAGENIMLENGKPERISRMSLGTIINNIRNNRFDLIRQSLNPAGEVLASERSAGGLTQGQIKTLQRLVSEGKLEDVIKIKDSAPFVPAVLIAYLALQITGDIIWNLIL